ncbi:DJ-1/PfpI family protein [Ectothiorhodospiraceae bacterium WFHF3C12]|nr:DJ-1/PfpI family protein [Ectothiorhodospiraceae bacterium WFHF3C12]
MASVLVPIADGSEELEAISIIDLLRRAGIEVTVAGLHGVNIQASRGVNLVADASLDDVLDQPFDMIVLPGGAAGAEALRADERIKRLLQTYAESGRYTAAICAAPGVLANAGLLEGRRATSFPGFLDPFAGVDYSEDAVVTDGRTVTSRGPGTAMDFALRLIEILDGADKAREVEERLQRPPGQRLFGEESVGLN